MGWAPLCFSSIVWAIVTNFHHHLLRLANFVEWIVDSFQSQFPILEPAGNTCLLRSSICVTNSTSHESRRLCISIKLFSLHDFYCPQPSTHSTPPPLAQLSINTVHRTSLHPHSKPSVPLLHLLLLSLIFFPSALSPFVATCKTCSFQLSWLSATSFLLYFITDTVWGEISMKNNPSIWCVEPASKFELKVFPTVRHTPVSNWHSKTPCTVRNIVPTTGNKH